MFLCMYLAYHYPDFVVSSQSERTNETADFKIQIFFDFFFFFVGYTVEYC